MKLYKILAFSLFFLLLKPYSKAQTFDQFWQKEGVYILASMAHPTNIYEKGIYDIRGENVWINITYVGGIETLLKIQLNNTKFTNIEVISDTDWFPPFNALPLLYEQFNAHTKNASISQTNALKEFYEVYFNKEINYFTEIEMTVFLLAIKWVEYLSNSSTIASQKMDFNEAPQEFRNLSHSTVDGIKISGSHDFVSMVEFALVLIKQIDPNYYQNEILKKKGRDAFVLNGIIQGCHNKRASTIDKDFNIKLCYDEDFTFDENNKYVAFEAAGIIVHENMHIHQEYSYMSTIGNMSFQNFLNYFNSDFTVLSKIEIQAYDKQLIFLDHAKKLIHRSHLTKINRHIESVEKLRFSYHKLKEGNNLIYESYSNNKADELRKYEKGCKLLSDAHYLGNNVACKAMIKLCRGSCEYR